MKILVLIKEVPNMEKVKFDSERGVVDRKSASAEINPFDESALQAALDFREAYGGTVTVMTMGPGKAVASLREAYARGADDGILLTDIAFGGSDTLATSRTLAAAVAKGDYDLILCGEKSVDGDTAQVGAEIAEMLGLPHAYYVDQIRRIQEEGDASENDCIEVEIENLQGKRQVRRMQTPCLIAVTKNIGTLKLPTVSRKLESLQQEMQTLKLADLPTLTKEQCGFNGSPTKVAKIQVPKTIERESKLFREEESEFADCMMNILREEGILS